MLHLAVHDTMIGFYLILVRGEESEIENVEEKLFSISKFVCVYFHFLLRRQNKSNQHFSFLIHIRCDGIIRVAWWWYYWKYRFAGVLQWYWIVSYFVIIFILSVIAACLFKCKNNLWCILNITKLYVQICTYDQRISKMANWNIFIHCSTLIYFTYNFFSADSKSVC